MVQIGASQELETIKRLSKEDENFRLLLKDIEINYQRIAQKKEILPLKFYFYRTQKGESLFTIAARLNLNYDSIASLNRLASPALLEEGFLLILPNIPALYLYNETTEPLFLTIKSRLHTEERMPFSAVYYHPEERRDLHINVYINQKFSTQERLTFLSGFFLWPITGERIITSDYGRRIDPIAHQSYHHHNGIDLRLAMGSDVFASRMGRVRYVGYNDVLGHHLILQHDQGFETIYGHLTRSIVQVGENIHAGQKIAISGNSGLSTGPHLHFEIRKYGKPIDPKPFFVNN
nr:M23 family metallopeptidase [Entomospira culicis]